MEHEQHERARKLEHGPALSGAGDEDMKMSIGLLWGAGDEDADADGEQADQTANLSKLFVFALSWSIGGLLDTAERIKFDEYLRSHDKNKTLPKGTQKDETVFDFRVASDTGAWERWQALGQGTRHTHGLRHQRWGGRRVGPGVSPAVGCRSE